MEELIFVFHVIVLLTLVSRIGAVSKRETIQTTITARRQLLIVQTDLDRMGNTMTINLCQVEEANFVIEQQEWQIN